MQRLRIGIAQQNSTVGDLSGNTEKIIRSISEARALGVDLLTFPELAICGYPPEDLLFKPQFIEENLRSLDKVVAASAGIAAVVGFVDAKEDIYNAAAIIHDGRLAGVYHKMFLPNYGVFDEDRYFRAGSRCPVYILHGIGIGVTICEDIWYEGGPAAAQAYAGAEVLVNISASPYHFGKGTSRERMLSIRAYDNVAIFAYNNLVGGQDEVIFDGNSTIHDEKGSLMAHGRQFEEDLIIADLDVESVFRTRLHDPRLRKAVPPANGRFPVERIVLSEAPSQKDKPALPARTLEVKGMPGEVYDALVLGVHDYVNKNGFKKVVLGLSGGIDSSLVAAIAVDALGSENVTGVSMPSRFSTPGSVTDAQMLADNLKIKMLSIPIEKAYQAYLDLLAGPFKGTQFSVAEENLQARARGNIIMALSNKFGWLVLTTGNKSEMATGYATLYGDMAGGFAVLKDVPKTLVYHLARYRNGLDARPAIPESVLTKPASAELRPEQKTAEALAPFDILDPVLLAYVEEDKSVEQIINMGYDKELVQRIARMVDANEYKRRQSPPGIKITARAFGRDRRLPITNKYKGF